MAVMTVSAIAHYRAKTMQRTTASLKYGSFADGLAERTKSDHLLPF